MTKNSAERPASIFFIDQRKARCMRRIDRSSSTKLHWRIRFAENRGPDIFAASARSWRNFSTVIAPNAAIFGEKDFQQLAIIRRMVRDLNFPIEIIGAPIVREPDGLACSSRNQYLNAEERAQATVLRKACLAAADLFARSKPTASDIVATAHATIKEAPLARIDYVELVDVETLQPVDSLGKKSLLALAVFFGKTRLIDNIQLG